jgi:hypothetical protein
MRKIIIFAAIAAAATGSGGGLPKDETESPSSAR